MDYSALKARWEHMVVSEPWIAFRAGPPSWLVREEWNEGKESFHDANERVKARYFEVDGSPKLTVDKTVDIPETVDIDRGQMCDCGQPVAPQRKKCWACIKKASRSR